MLLPARTGQTTGDEAVCGTIGAKVGENNTAAENWAAEKRIIG
jgi:hypothetical protein